MCVASAGRRGGRTLRQPRVLPQDCIDVESRHPSASRLGSDWGYEQRESGVARGDELAVALVQQIKPEHALRHHEPADLDRRLIQKPRPIPTNSTPPEPQIRAVAITIDHQPAEAAASLLRGNRYMPSEVAASKDPS